MAYQKESGCDVTTLMLRNLPYRYRLDEFYRELVDLLGTDQAIDFVYLPWDVKKDRNVGYGFVNAAHVTLVQSCVNILDEQCFGGAAIPCSVTPATIQGVASNLQSLWQRAKLGYMKQGPTFIWKGKHTGLDMVEVVLREVNFATPAPSYFKSQSLPKRSREERSVVSYDVPGVCQTLAPMTLQPTGAERNFGERPPHTIAVRDADHDVLVKFFRRWGQ